MLLRTLLLSALVIIPGTSAGTPAIQFHIERIPLGEITTPHDLEIRGEIWVAGQYHLELLDGGRRVGIALARSDGSQVSTDDAAIEELKEPPAVPRVELSIVTKDRIRFLKIAVYREKRLYTRLIRCSDGGTPGGARRSEIGPLDPAIEVELEIVKEVHALVRMFGRQAWPGWNDIDALRFSLTFPNRTVVTVDRDDKAVPPRFTRLPGKDIDRKGVYIDRSRETPGRLAQHTSMRGHGDITGVEVSLMDSVVPVQGQETSPRAREQYTQYTTLAHALFYIHEAFHAFRAGIHVDGGRAAPIADSPSVSTDFDPTLQYSVNADFEGRLLLKAYREPDDARALGYFKESLVARALKRQAMPPGAIAAERMFSREEGTATYAQLKIATLIKNAGYRGQPGNASGIMAAALARADEYLAQEMELSLESTAGRTLDVGPRDYIYGAFQCALLDRVAPDWKVGFFEHNRTLDEAVETAVPLSADETRTIADRLKTEPTYADLLTKHRRVIQERDEAVQLVTNRRGVTYSLDLTSVYAEHRSALAAGLPYGGKRFYPHGVKELSSPGMRLVSRDTPMRLDRTLLEWIDADAKTGEQGYELKYEKRADDQYLNATVTCRGFTLTAKAITINKNGDAVRITIVSQ